MSELKWLKKIDSTIIKKKSRNLIGFELELQEMRNLIDLLSDQKKDLTEHCSFFDISGKILLYGEPGTGKSSLAYKLADEFLDGRDEIESYYLPIENIVTSALGEATKNICDAFSEVKRLASEQFVIIILDEIDRFLVDRTDRNELSELKRMFDSILDFLDSIDEKSNLLIIGITNIKNNLEQAFLRRFTIIREISANAMILKQFIQNCNQKLGINMSSADIEEIVDKQSLKTCNQIKRVYREVLLRKNYLDWINLTANDIKEGFGL